MKEEEEGGLCACACARGKYHICGAELAGYDIYIIMTVTYALYFIFPYFLFFIFYFFFVLLDRTLCPG